MEQQRNLMNKQKNKHINGKLQIIKKLTKEEGKKPKEIAEEIGISKQYIYII